MAVTYTNNWKNIADKLKSLCAKEFGRALPVYVGEGEYSDRQFMKIIPLSDELIEPHLVGEVREYLFNFSLYVMESGNVQISLTNIFRLLARIESLIGGNRHFELADSSTIMEGSLDSYEIEEGSEVYKYIVNMDFSCLHYGNIL